MIREKLWIVLLSASSCALFSLRNEAADSWHVEGYPKAVAQEIHFTNGDARLVGTLYLPEHGDHLPAVIALHGASDATRDAGVYRHLREGLPTMGVAVLIYDRRGTGASSGTLSGISYETLADDGSEAQKAVAKVPRIDSRKIGFWGLSQGGWLAVLAAERSKDAAFAISVSAPLASPELQMEFATTNLLNVRGYSGEDVQQMLESRKAWAGYLRGATPRTAAVEALQKAEAQPWFNLAFMPKASQLTTDPAHNSWRREMDYDPAAAVRRLKIPLLFIYGGSDPWIPVEQSIKQLRALADKQPNVRYVIVPNANHEMMFVEHDTMDFDEKTMKENAPQAPKYFMALASWLCQQIKK
jgi:dipeptidyl aminopeptidase/acylaminoacyl peptidase